MATFTLKMLSSKCKGRESIFSVFKKILGIYVLGNGATLIKGQQLQGMNPMNPMNPMNL